MTNNLADKITEKIKKENIQPKPKWVFLLKDYVIWGVFTLNIFLGGLFFAVTLLVINNTDWDIYKYLDGSLWRYFISVLPYFRLSALLLFLFLAFYNYRHTPRGYRYKNRKIIIMSVIISGMIGLTLFLFGAGYKIEQLFFTGVPFYKSLEQHRQEMWYRPEAGLLSGEVVEIISSEKIKIKDYKNKFWLIDVSETSWRGPVRHPQVSKQLKIIGQKVSPKEFKAKEIRPWFGGRHNRAHRK